MSTVKFRVVQTIGSYEDKEGNTKNSYQEVGVVFENEKGHVSMKMNAYPLPNEKGEVWLNLFPIGAQKPAKKKSK